VKLPQRVALFQQRLQELIAHSELNRSGFARSIQIDRSTLFSAS